MVSRLISILLILALGTETLAQNTRNQALSLARRAVKVMQKGYYEDAIPIFERALELDPDNIHILYQLSLVYYFQGEYAQTVEILKETVRDPEAPMEHFAFLGNAYDNLGDGEAAMKSYRRGQRKYPQNGRIYTEMGISTLNAGQFTQAMAHWEMGIDQAPTYESNYYWAAKALANTPEKLWALLYGELYLLLSSAEEKGMEMSRLLFDTYAISVEALGDEMVLFHFSERAYERPGDERWALRKTDVGSTFEQIFVEHFQSGGESWVYGLHDIDDMAQARLDLLQSWQRDSASRERFPNPLFDYWGQILETGHWDAYHYWLFQAGDPEAFQQWATSQHYDAALADWLAWKAEHPLLLDSERRMSQALYQGE